MWKFYALFMVLSLKAAMAQGRKPQPSDLAPQTEGLKLVLRLPDQTQLLYVVVQIKLLCCLTHLLCGLSKDPNLFFCLQLLPVRPSLEC